MTAPVIIGNATLYLGDWNHADCDQEHWRRSARKILAQIQADPELADLYRFCGWLV